jgi:hypothetical protein
MMNRPNKDEKDLVLTIGVPVVQEDAKAVSNFGVDTRIDFAAGFEVKAGELRGINAAKVMGIKHR